MSRRRRATLTVAFVAMVMVGSWCVVTAATGSTPAPARGRAPHAVDAAPSRVSTATVAPRPAPAPSAVPTTTTTAAPTVTAPAIPITTSRPPPAPVKAPPTSPAPVASAVSGTSPVAISLISVINQKSGGKEAIPVTADNIALLARWMANEGGLWADNPLNTSLHSGGYPHQYTASGQDTGIPIFSNMSVGIDATAATLLSNPSYARILRTLRSGSASCLTFATAVVRSPWASGHYGHDPSGFCSGRITPHRRTHRRHHGK